VNYLDKEYFSTSWEEELTFVPNLSLSEDNLPLDSSVITSNDAVPKLQLRFMSIVRASVLTENYYFEQSSDFGSINYDKNVYSFSFNTTFLYFLVFF